MPLLSRCSACSCKYRPVPGDGPIPCTYMAIGERPGPDENRAGRPFIGRSGQEQNENYFRLAGLSRSEVYVTNAVKCYAEGNRKPTTRELVDCSHHHLADELYRVKPDIIFLLGGTACSLAGVTPGIDLETHHGTPILASVLGWTGVVIPMYHPAAGMHDTRTMIPLLEDWERLYDFLHKDKWPYPDNQYKQTDYKLLNACSGLKSYLHNTDTLAAIDTESYEGLPWSIQVSNRPGTARMFRTDNRDMIRTLNIWLSRSNCCIALHNAGQDQDMLEAAGVNPIYNFRDTMQEAYHMGNLPQGLKPLGYRLCGVTMQSYDDLVKPHSNKALMEWLVLAHKVCMERFSTSTTVQMATKIKTVIKPGRIQKDLTRIYTHMLRSTSYDGWKKIRESVDRWGDVEQQQWSVLESLIALNGAGEKGKFPSPGLAHVPIEEAVQYACADADITRRIACLFDSMRKQSVQPGGRFHVTAGDEDA